MKKILSVAAIAVFAIGMTSCSKESKYVSNYEKIEKLRLEIDELQAENKLIGAQLMEEKSLDDMVKIAEKLAKVEKKMNKKEAKQAKKIKEKYLNPLAKYEDSDKYKDNKKAFYESKQVEQINKDVENQRKADCKEILGKESVSEYLND